jgi:hypothetical protein
MDLNLKDALNYLIDNGYMGRGPAGLCLTEKFYREENSFNTVQVLVPSPINLMVPALVKDWSLAFIQFIAAAKVPRQLEGTRGDIYIANKYSEAGMKAFRKALESGVDYDLLLKSTQLYYKSNVKLKKAVGNYFAEGLWRSDYEAMKEAAGDGTTLTNHIKQEIQTNEHNPYRRG